MIRKLHANDRVHHSRWRSFRWWGFLKLLCITLVPACSPPCQDLPNSWNVQQMGSSAISTTGHPLLNPERPLRTRVLAWQSTADSDSCVVVIEGVTAEDQPTWVLAALFRRHDDARPNYKAWRVPWEPHSERNGQVALLAPPTGQEVADFFGQLPTWGETIFSSKETLWICCDTWSDVTGSDPIPLQ